MGCTVLSYRCVGASLGVKEPWWTPQGAGRVQGEEPSLQGPLSCCRDGNSSVLVHFRLHFLLLALRSLDLGLERELLQQGLRTRLQGHGVPLGAHGTIVSAELTGK